MSSKSRKQHAKPLVPEPAPLPVAGDEDSEPVDTWVPDWGRQCEVCGRKGVKS
jgi:hypothetical protein